MRCSSDAIHCGFECVKKYGPGTETVIIKPGGGIQPGGIDTIGSEVVGEETEIKVEKKLTCEREEKLPNGKKCTRRLCVPLMIH